MRDEPPPLVWPLASGAAGGPVEAALRRAAAVSGVAPEDVRAVGSLAALERPALGLFCSARCPGGAILRALDLAHALRDAGVPVVSGFHSPVERECLRLLLRGSQPVIVCVARDMARMRIPPEWREPLAAGRLLLLSASGSGERRATAREAERRNRFAAALAAVSLVAYAAPGARRRRWRAGSRRAGSRWRRWRTPARRRCWRWARRRCARRGWRHGGMGWRGGRRGGRRGPEGPAHGRGDGRGPEGPAHGTGGINAPSLQAPVACPGLSRPGGSGSGWW